MKLVSIQRNTMSGQCKGALLRLQVRHTAVFLFPGLVPGWAGSNIGLFVPRKTENGYACVGFRFHPHLAPDIAWNQLPKWYRTLTRALSFRFD